MANSLWARVNQSLKRCIHSILVSNIHCLLLLPVVVANLSIGLGNLYIAPVLTLDCVGGLLQSSSLCFFFGKVNIFLILC